MPKANTAHRTEAPRGLRDLLFFAAAAATALVVAGHPRLSQQPAVLRSAGPPTSSGITASTPSEIPARGWWSIAKRAATRASDHRIVTEAAGITFYSLLALFPAIAALISLYGLFADPKAVADHLDAMAGFLPGGAMEIISEQVKALTSSPPKALGFSLISGLLVSLWSANAAIKALFDALNIVYDEREKRSFVRRTLVSLSFTMGALLVMVLALVALVVLPALLGPLGLAEVTALLLRVLRWPLLLVAVGALLALLYRYGPSRQEARWRWVTWGSAFAALAWLLFSVAFSWYAANFGTYNKTYGSLGAAVGFMTWIWLSGIVVLAGAELNAEAEHQTARDTTTGPEQPLGTRGAEKADTVAA